MCSCTQFQDEVRMDICCKCCGRFLLGQQDVLSLGSERASILVAFKTQLSSLEVPSLRCTTTP